MRFRCKLCGNLMQIGSTPGTTHLACRKSWLWAIDAALKEIDVARPWDHMRKAVEGLKKWKQG